MASFIIHHRRVFRLHKHPHLHLHLHLQERFLNAAARLGGISLLVFAIWRVNGRQLSDANRLSLTGKYQRQKRAPMRGWVGRGVGFWVCVAFGGDDGAGWDRGRVVGDGTGVLGMRKGRWALIGM